jgi:hypothetical protein
MSTSQFEHANPLHASANNMRKGVRSAFDFSFISFAVTSRIVTGTGMGPNLPLTNLAS